MKLFYTLLLVLTTSTAAFADDAEIICKEKWGEDHSRMFAYCIKEEIQAKKDLEKWYSDTEEFEILDKCVKTWTENFTVNYQKALYCAKKGLRKKGYHTK